ncbi:MAG: S9 family peptidase [Nakamurella sp.]
MKPTDLPLLRSAGRPVLLPDGRVVVAVSHPELDDDRTVSKLVLIDTDGSQRDFTSGPRDSGPVLSPDGGTVVFGKAAESGPPQLHAIRVDGGEARKLTDHKLGASSPVFSPDGGTLAYLAGVPESGRYGTDEKVTADAEPPRRLTSLSYRSDGKGFVLDKPEQIFVIPVDFDPAAKDAAPARATSEPRGAGKPAFLADGSALVYSRATGQDDITSGLVTVALPSGTGESASQATPQVLVTGLGDVAAPVVDGETVYFGGVTFSDVDFPGRNVGLFAVPVGGGTPRRLTEEQTVDLSSEPVVDGDRLLIQVQNKGAIDLRSVTKDADNAALDQLPLVLGGQQVVKELCIGAVGAATRLAAVVGDPTSFAEVVTGELTDTGLTDQRTVTDLGGELKKAGLAETIELSGTGKDGYPVHGWLLLPAGSGPHPVLLNVHGGPHSPYSWSLFDEAQVYVAAGYAVVMGNPRGSAGYGQDHGRAIVNAMGTVDVDDVLALLDLALQRDELDSARVGVMGGSYGGFMTSWLASHAADRFVAGISERAVNAWDSFSGASDIGHFFAEAYVGAKRDAQWRASPLAYADAIDIPLLIIHSEHDWRCPLEQGQRLFTALKSRGAEAEMLLFPAEGHELSRGGRPRHRQQRFDAILEWWQRYLPVAAPAPPE